MPGNTKPAREPRYVPIREGAAYVRRPTRTVRSWAERGLIPIYRLGPRLLQVDLNDLDDLRQRVG